MRTGKEGSQRSWWRLGRSKAAQTETAIDAGSGLPADQWLTTQLRELEDRSLSERAPIAVVKVRVEDDERATEEDLVDVVGRLESVLRAYERLFRVGARDFILLAPGADLAKGAAMARKLRDKVGAVAMWRGGFLQIQCGVSASIEGEPFIYEHVAMKAEEALENADRQGGVGVVESARRDRLTVVAEGTFPGRDADAGGENDSSPRRLDGR